MLREGVIEKKGHGLGAFNWGSRLLRIRTGELLYYKMEDKLNALNIVPLVRPYSFSINIGSAGLELVCV